MMLSSFLPKIEQRYVVVGSAAGAVLPVSFFSIARLAGHTGSFIDWALQNPSQFTLAAMPVWMGLVSLQFARGQRRRRHDAAVRRRHERQLLHAARHDQLTGIANRAAFETAARRACATNAEYAVLLLDLDRFKLVNDTKGHHAGDKLLQQFARRLQAFQAGHKGVSAYRLGGDEFIVFVENDTSHARLEQLAETVKSTVVLPFDLKEGQVSVGVSIGVAQSSAPGEAIETVMKRADLALYSAKDIQGSAHAFYDEMLAVAAFARQELEQDLTKAVNDGEFCLEFQPIVATDSGKVTAMEALVRWLHPQRGLMLPERFLPAAERCGLMAKLDAWVLRAACSEAASWPDNIAVTVNISSSLFEDDGFPAMLVRCLDMSGLSPKRLTVEISESVLSLDQIVVRGRLAQLRALGVRVTLHDFGLGLSSLNRLVDADLDGLKLERSFTDALLLDARGEGLMDAMIRLGAAMQVSTSIGGIEDERQMEFVRHRGAAQLQGHLLSRPVPAGEVIDYLTSQPGPETDDSAAA